MTTGEEMKKVVSGEMKADMSASKIRNALTDYFKA